jgi:hypothetical protein
MRPQEETNRVWSRESLEGKRLAEYPEEVGLVFLRELLHGEVRFMLLNRPGIVNNPDVPRIGHHAASRPHAGSGWDRL